MESSYPYRPPSGPPLPPPSYYQHPARPPPPPPPPTQATWYSNQFHNPHSPSPPPQPPSQWRQPPPHFPMHHSHQPPFNGNSQFPPQANQEWAYHQGHASQGNSNVEDWAVKAREYAAANQNPNSHSNGQVYHHYHHNHAYQQLPVHDGFPTGLPHPPTSAVNHQQEVPYSYSSLPGEGESGNAPQHEMQISVADAGGPVHADQQIQYAYVDQRAATPSNLSDQPLQFATRENSDYATLHNAWPPHAATGVVYPPNPSSVPSIPQHDTSMAMPPASGHTMHQFGRFPPLNNQPVGPPYAFGTKPPLHPVAAFMDDSYAASSVPPKKAVPDWLKVDILKHKASLGRPSSGSFEERDSMDYDVVPKPPVHVDQQADKSFSPSKSSDEEEEDEDEMDPARSAAINLEIKRILTEVLLKVTDELFDEIATKVIKEDEVIPKDNSFQHDLKSSSSLISAADPVHQASAEILVSVGGGDKKSGSGSPADVLGLGSYASDDDDDGDGDAASNAGADGSDGVEGLGMGPRNDVPNTEKLPEPKTVVNARLDPEVKVGEMSPMNNNSGLDQILGSRRNGDEGGSNKNLDISASSGLNDDITGSRTNHPDRTDTDKDATLDEPHKKNSGIISDCNLRQDSNDSHGKDLSDNVSRDRSRTDEMTAGKEKIDSQNGSKDRLKQNDIKAAEKVKGFESNKKSTDLHVKKDSRDVERSHRGSSKEDRGKKREKEKQEGRSRHRQAEDSSKDKRRRSPTSDGSSDDSTRKSRSRRRNISPSPVRKSSSRRRNRSPSPGRSKRRHVSSRSPHSKHSQRKHTVHSSHDTSRSKRSRSRSPRRRHRA